MNTNTHTENTSITNTHTLDIPTRRLRVRRVDENAAIERACAISSETGRMAIHIAHGGSVNNSYGYPAETEGVVAAATPDGRVWCCVERLPANKVTLSGAFFAVTGLRGLFDHRFSDDKKAECRKRFFRQIGFAA